MCGFVAVQSRIIDPLRAAEDGLSRILHRGPNGFNVSKIPDTDIALGHARLAILDTSDAGLQPMRSECNGDLIVFNGEIYNFIELRVELEELGVSFRTQTDTEVILKGWMIWRERLFPKLNGMWSLVLYDKACGNLVIARDRLGVKPLYVHRSAKLTVFGSEIQCLLPAMGSPSPNHAALHDFLMFGMTDHGPDTLLEGVSIFPAGSYGVASPDGDMRVVSYHHWPEGRGAGIAAEELRDLVEDSVRLRLRSDAPTMSFLSGGLDSGIITDCCVRAAPFVARSDYVGAFTYANPESGDRLSDPCSEYGNAVRFFEGLGSPYRHVSKTFAPTYSEDDLFELTSVVEEPLCNPSFIAAYRSYDYLSSTGIRVVLNGEGADETFGGYPRKFLSWAAADALKRGNPFPAMSGVRSGAMGPADLLSRLAYLAPDTMLDRLYLSRHGGAEIIRSEFLERHAGARFAEYGRRRRGVGDEIARMTVESNLPMLLRYTDRMSMRFGLEVRSPYLDYRVVEAGLSAPIDSLIAGGGTKMILRKAFAGRLPDDVCNRPKYAGFGNGEEVSFMNVDYRRIWDEIPSWMNDVIDVENLRRTIDRKQARFSTWWALSALIWASTSFSARRA